MLFRMYTRWAERHGYVCKTLDYLDGDEAGLKSATISIEGENAYGHLKSEHGVHRLVRVSPFDANARRQTSFAALEVMPEIPDDVEVDIRPEDVEMQVFRSSGAGGQQDFRHGRVPVQGWQELHLLLLLLHGQKKRPAEVPYPAHAAGGVRGHRHPHPTSTM